MTAKVAIVGSGPAGCYLAQALDKALDDVEITIIDRLPVPYGLIRYGVAPDHQGTKAVVRQFARLFERQGVGFAGNIEVGRDVSLADLRAMMDVVVLASGLSRDRTLDVPGADLDGVFGSGAVTRYWNGHPESGVFQPRFGTRVAVIGNGNVALDIVRILSKREGDFAGSDLDPAHVNAEVEEIHVIGRSPLEQARFDAAMLRELGSVAGLACTLADGDTLSDGDNPCIAALHERFAADTGSATRRIVFHSGWSPVAFQGAGGRIAAIDLQRTGGEEGKSLSCDSLVTAIGFDDDGKLGRSLLLSTAKDAEAGIIDDGLFVAGWFKRGPRGTIPENRRDSQIVAENVAQWLSANGMSQKPGFVALKEQFAGKMTCYQDWLAIDAAETQAAAADRCRRKIVTIPAMLETIEDRRRVA